MVIFMYAKLLSHFSHVQLCATPKTAAHQAPPSLGFSRQEYLSRVPLPFPLVLPKYPVLLYPTTVYSIDSILPFFFF